MLSAEQADTDNMTGSMLVDWHTFISEFSGLRFKQVDSAFDLALESFKLAWGAESVIGLVAFSSYISESISTSLHLLFPMWILCSKQDPIQHCLNLTATRKYHIVVGVPVRYYWRLFRVHVYSGTRVVQYKMGAETVIAAHCC